MKKVVTDPKEAMTILASDLNSSTPIKMPGSKARYATVSMIRSWGLQNGVDYDRGWLGRSLNLAEDSGLKVTSQPWMIDDRRTLAYRHSK
jgi:hypothetical protein